jgi:hypothetical protein
VLFAVRSHPHANQPYIDDILMGRGTLSCSQRHLASVSLSCLESITCFCSASYSRRVRSPAHERIREWSLHA